MRSEYLAETIHRTLESNRSVSSEEMEAISQSFLQYLDRTAAIAREQLQEAIKGEDRKQKSESRSRETGDGRPNEAN